MPITTATAMLLLAALLAAAVVTDLRSRRIPNLLVLAGLAMAFAMHAIALASHSKPPTGAIWWAPLAGLVAGLVMLMPLYLLRGCGAGDVKLMAMVGAFIGVKAVLAAALYTLLAGGALSLVFMLVDRGIAAHTLANVRLMLSEQMAHASGSDDVPIVPLQHTAARLPYAVAIALGTGASLLWPLVRN